MKGIVDTGLLVASANRQDRHHAWAVQVVQGITEPLLTCEAVLAESAYLLRSSRLVLDFVRTGMVRIAFDASQHVERLAALSRKFEALAPDLADLCLIRMSELYPRHAVITTDRADFSIYRRNQRELIPLLCPD